MSIHLHCNCCTACMQLTISHLQVKKEGTTTYLEELLHTVLCTKDLLQPSSQSLMYNIIAGRPCKPQITDVIDTEMRMQLQMVFSSYVFNYTCTFLLIDCHDLHSTRPKNCYILKEQPEIFVPNNGML